VIELKTCPILADTTKQEKTLASTPDLKGGWGHPDVRAENLNLLGFCFYWQLNFGQRIS
jgi:hypothetical protein